MSVAKSHLEGGDLLYVQSSAASRNADPDEHVFHATTRIETAAPNFDWLNYGVFVTVAGRTSVNMLFETYLVG